MNRKICGSEEEEVLEMLKGTRGVRSWGKIFPGIKRATYPALVKQYPEDRFLVFLCQLAFGGEVSLPLKGEEPPPYQGKDREGKMAHSKRYRSWQEAVRVHENYERLCEDLKKLVMPPVMSKFLRGKTSEELLKIFASKKPSKHGDGKGFEKTTRYYIQSLYGREYTILSNVNLTGKLLRGTKAELDIVVYDPKTNEVVAVGEAKSNARQFFTDLPKLLKALSGLCKGVLQCSGLPGLDFSSAKVLLCASGNREKIQKDLLNGATDKAWTQDCEFVMQGGELRRKLQSPEKHLKSCLDKLHKICQYQIHAPEAWGYQDVWMSWL